MTIGPRENSSVPTYSTYPGRPNLEIMLHFEVLLLAVQVPSIGEKGGKRREREREKERESFTEILSFLERFSPPIKIQYISVINTQEST
jgi:hypothetical protein